MTIPYPSHPGDADHRGRDDLMTVWEAAAFLRVHPRMLRLAARIGQVPATRRDDGELVFSRAELCARMRPSSAGMRGRAR